MQPPNVACTLNKTEPIPCQSEEGSINPILQIAHTRKVIRNIRKWLNICVHEMIIFRNWLLNSNQKQSKSIIGTKCVWCQLAIQQKCRHINCWVSLMGIKDLQIKPHTGRIFHNFSYIVYFFSKKCSIIPIPYFGEKWHMPPHYSIFHVSCWNESLLIKLRKGYVCRPFSMMASGYHATILLHIFRSQVV